MPTLAATVLLAPLFTVGLAPLPDAETPAPMRSVQACAACHAAEVADWKHSRHGQAFRNAIFQREYRQQPLDWCVHCHAPLQSQFDEVKRGGGPLSDEGVGCAACHVRQGQILSRSRSEKSPHNTLVQEDFGGPDFCAGCHQFNFPLFAQPGGRGQVSGYSPFPMQDTVAQFKKGPHHGRRCGDCHSRGSAGHRFPGAHDPAMLSRALSYTLCRWGDNLQVVLQNQGAGHNVPTGDVHRHILLRLWRSDHPERLFEYSLGRRYEVVPSGGKRTVLDTTLPADGSRTVTAQLSRLGALGNRDAAAVINLELRYVYTIDEFPLPSHELLEPTSSVISSERLELGRVQECTNGNRPDAISK